VEDASLTKQKEERKRKEKRELEEAPLKEEPENNLLEKQREKLKERDSTRIVFRI